VRISLETVTDFAKGTLQQWFQGYTGADDGGTGPNGEPIQWRVQLLDTSGDDVYEFTSLVREGDPPADRQRFRVTVKVEELM
jgi:hypothetical protein